MSAAAVMAILGVNRKRIAEVTYQETIPSTLFTPYASAGTNTVANKIQSPFDGESEDGFLGLLSTLLSVTCA